VKPGDLVEYHFQDKLYAQVTLRGIIISIQPEPHCFRDSMGNDQIYTATILFDRDVPPWMGNGRIGKLTDTFIRVVQSAGAGG
jgi:hypothetical protein